MSLGGWSGQILRTKTILKLGSTTGVWRFTSWRVSRFVAIKQVFFNFSRETTESYSVWRTKKLTRNLEAGFCFHVGNCDWWVKLKVSEVFPQRIAWRIAGGETSGQPTCTSRNLRKRNYLLTPMLKLMWVLVNYLACRKTHIRPC